MKSKLKNQNIIQYYNLIIVVFIISNICSLYTSLKHLSLNKIKINTYLNKAKLNSNFNKNNLNFKLSSNESNTLNINNITDNNNTKNYLFNQSISKNKKETMCDSDILDFSYSLNTTYENFIFMIKTLNLKLSLPELKIVYKFLDGKSTGSFSQKRWLHFYKFFLNEFIKCDTNKDCVINDQELLNCVNNSLDLKIILLPENNDKVFKKSVFKTPKDKITSIVKSLDYTNLEGINLTSFLLLKKIVISYKEVNVNNQLDKEGFKKALNIMLYDYNLDSFDIDLIFNTARQLVFKDTNNYILSFSEYFEIGRITSNFLNYNVNISYGFLSYKDTVNNSVVWSKMNSDYFKRYYSLYNNNIINNNKKIEIFAIADNNETLNNKQIILDPMNIRYQDYAFLEYWANIFDSFIDKENINNKKINKNNFNMIVKNKMKDNYQYYIAYSNFQEANNLKSTYDKIKTTETEYLTGKISFMSIEDKESLIDNNKNNKIENNNNINDSSIDDNNKYNTKFINENSLFNNLEDNSNNINFIQNKESTVYSNKNKSVFNYLKNIADKTTELPFNSNTSNISKNNLKNNFNYNSLLDISTLDNKLNPNIDKLFDILDFSLEEYIYFDQFILLVKYLQLYEIININNTDNRGINKSSYIGKLRADLHTNPELSLEERNKLSTLANLNCNFMDFLFFFDYMIASYLLRPYVNEINTNYIDELHLLVALKKLNLGTGDIDNIMYNNIKKMNNLFDYDSAIISALSKKCEINEMMFQPIISKNTNATNYKNNYNN